MFCFVNIVEKQKNGEGIIEDMQNISERENLMSQINNAPNNSKTKRKNKDDDIYERKNQTNERKRKKTLNPIKLN